MQNSKTFKEYLTSEFLKDLNDYIPKALSSFKNRHKKDFTPADCSHHHVPSGSAFPFEPGDLKNCEPHFIFALYTTTLLNESVHRYCPNKVNEWQKCFGKYQLPMIHPVAYGCYRAVYPCLLFFNDRAAKKQIDLPECLLNEVCDYFVNEIPNILISAGINPGELLKQIVDDGDFNRLQNKYEEQLRQRLTENN